ncbi:MAG: serine/threonine-protein kinase [Verrucomicrobiales bacterium]|nr:serine/threonine-protein kinase [Verrucomicrobiales bacterium]
MNPRYEIRETIGQGGLGSVFKAYDTQLQREVAMKRVLTTGQATDEEVHAAGDKLISEAQTLSTLNHPNIVTVFDVGHDDEGGFVVMELLNGETLDETVERGVLTAEDFKEVVFQTMEGLVAAQDKNVIHRDIKPTNIMLIWQASGRFQLKILDFGLAKFSKSPSVQTMDQDDAVMGSIFFMAPEQFERAELDARTDLYQMGCVYYNALTGQYPFNGETAPQVMNAHLQHKVVPIDQLRPDLPPAMAQWVMWLINRDIGSRPANAKEALKYFPKDTTSAQALPAQAVIESTKVATIAGSPSVKVALPGGRAKAPPNLIVGGSRSTGTFVRGSSGPITPRRSTSGVGGAPEKKGLSPTVIVSIAGAVVIAIIGGLLLVKQAATKKNEARMELLHGVNGPAATAKDVDMLVKFMKGDDRAKKVQAYETLKKVRGGVVDQEILEEMKNADSSFLQKQLANIVSSRGYTPAFSTLMGLSNSSRKEDDKIFYLRAAQPLATDENIESILTALKETDSLGLRGVYEDTMASILHRSKDAEATLSVIRQRVKTASGGERRSLFRVLGLMGGEKTEQALERIFKGSDVAAKADAISAYYSWPNREPLEKVAALAASKEKIITKPAMRAYTILSGRPAPITIGQYIEDWQKGFELMQDDPSELGRMIQRVVVETPHPRTVGMLKGWQEHPRYGRLSKAVATAMEQTLKRLPTMESGKELKGSKARVEGSNAMVNGFLESISNWTSPDTYFSWSFKAKQGGEYSISVLQADISSRPSDFLIYVGGKEFKGKSVQTPNLEEFKEVKLDGKVTLQAGEVYKLNLLAGENIQPRMMDIKGVVLKK